MTGTHKMCAANEQRVCILPDPLFSKHRCEGSDQTTAKTCEPGDVDLYGNRGWNEGD